MTEEEKQELLQELRAFVLRILRDGGTLQETAILPDALRHLLPSTKYPYGMKEDANWAL